MALNFPHFFAYLLKVCNYKNGDDEKCDASTDTLNASGVLIDKYLNFAELSNNNNNNNNSNNNNNETTENSHIGHCTHTSESTNVKVQ